MQQADNIQPIVKQAFYNALWGGNAHVNPAAAFEALDVFIAGKVVADSPFTIWQIINHLNFWQERFIGHLNNEPLSPVEKAIDGWPGASAPSSENELAHEIEKLLNYIKLVKKEYLEGAKDLNQKRDNYNSGYELLQAMASHLSYHLGQIVLLRRMQKAWPPPSGGDTW